jgi:selenocysteine lyase/cysteine desulfurase
MLVKFAPLKANSTVAAAALAALVTPFTKLVAISHANNS